MRLRQDEWWVDEVGTVVPAGGSVDFAQEHWGLVGSCDVITTAGL